MVTHVCMCVHTHVYMATHMRTHHCGSEILVSGQKKKLVEEWFVRGCRQLWPRGQAAPLPQRPEPTLLPMGPCGEYTRVLLWGRISLAGEQGGQLAELEGWVPVIPCCCVWDGPEHGHLWLVSQRCSCAPGRVTCTRKAVSALGSQGPGGCGLEVSALRMLRGIS